MRTRILSKFVTRTFLLYLLFEHALVTTLLGVGIPACLFFGILNFGRRNSDRALDMMQSIFSEEGRPLMLVVAIVACALNVGLLFMRRIPYVVSVELNDTRRCIIIGVRYPWTRSAILMEVAYDQFKWSGYSTLKIPTVPSYKGYEFGNGRSRVGLLLLDHFTWDDQARRVKEFLAELNERIPLSN